MCFSKMEWIGTCILLGTITAKSPANRPPPKGDFIFQPSIFKDDSFREGTSLDLYFRITIRLNGRFSLLLLVVVWHPERWNVGTAVSVSLAPAKFSGEPKRTRLIILSKHPWLSWAKCWTWEYISFSVYSFQWMSPIYCSNFSTIWSKHRVIDWE